MNRILVLQAPLGWFTPGRDGANYAVKRGGKVTQRIAYPPADGYIGSDDAKAQRKRLRQLCQATGDPKGGRLVLLFQWQRPFDICDANLHWYLHHVLRHFPGVRWAIFYDPKLAEAHAARDGEEWSFDEDLAGPLTSLTRHPQHWRIGPYPALYLWAIHSGDYDGEVATAVANYWRPTLADVFGSRPRNMASGMRDVPVIATGFVSRLPGHWPSSTRQLREVVSSDLIPAWQEWERAGFPVIPAVSLYDDRAFNPHGPSVIEYERGDFAWALDLAFDHASEIDGKRYVIGGTADNWFEGTHVLPCKVRGDSTLREIAEVMG